MSVGRREGGYAARPAPSGLADVIDTVLDKGLVLDVYVRVSLLGIELLTVDARVVVASVDTYLRFAAAVDRLDLSETQIRGVPGLVEQTASSLAKGAVTGAVDAVSEKAGEWLSGRRSQGRQR